MSWWRHGVPSWRHGTRHDDGFVIFEILDPENIRFKTKTIQFEQIVPEMLNYVMMTSQCPIMTSWYTSRWRLCYFRNPRPWKHMIQNKNHQIRANSSRDVEQCHDDVTVSHHDVTVHVTMTALLFSKSSTLKTYDSKQKPSNSGK